MEARAESSNRSQVERKKIEKQSAVCFRRQRNHFPFLIRAGMVVDPLQIGGFAAEAGTVVDKLAVDFASRKIYERHESLRFLSPFTYSIGMSSRPSCVLRIDSEQAMTVPCADSAHVRTKNASIRRPS